MQAFLSSRGVGGRETNQSSDTMPAAGAAVLPFMWNDLEDVAAWVLAPCMHNVANPSSSRGWYM